MIFHFLGHTEQGVRTAAMLFGKAAILSNQRANAWVPDYRPLEKETISSFVSIDKTEFFGNEPANPADAEFTVVFDRALLYPKQIREKSTVILNSQGKVSIAALKKKKVRVLSIDAYEHTPHGKRVFPNLVLLGFLASQYKKIQLGTLKRVIQEEFGMSEEKQHEVEAGFRLKGR